MNNLIGIGAMWLLLGACGGSYESEPAPERVDSCTVVASGLGSPSAGITTACHVAPYCSSLRDLSQPSIDCVSLHYRVCTGDALPPSACWPASVTPGSWCCP